MWINMLCIEEEADDKIEDGGKEKKKKGRTKEKKVWGHRAKNVRCELYA